MRVRSATATNIVTITPRSRNLSLGWSCIANRNHELIAPTCPTWRGGWNRVKEEMAAAKQASGSSYYTTTLFVDGKAVTNQTAQGILDEFETLRAIGRDVEIDVEVAA